MSKYEDYKNAKEFLIPAAMKALVLRGRGFENLALEEVAVPQINDDQLLARVDAAGVCTSILKIIRQGSEHGFINGWDIGRFPIVLGDEGSVTIVKVGANLRGEYSVGQRYSIQPAVDIAPILHRDRYRTGGEGMSKCAVGYTLGGHLGEYIRIQEEVLRGGCLLRLPDDGMSYFGVSMAEPISCVWGSQQRNVHVVRRGGGARQAVSGILAGGEAVIVGAGVMGRMHAEIAIGYGPRVLMVCDVRQDRVERVKKSIGKKAAAKGVELVCVGAGEVEAAVKKYSNGSGADDVIVAVGDRAVQQEALKLTGKGGVVNLFGGLAKGDNVLQVDAGLVHYNEMKLVGSSGGDRADMAESLEAIAAGDIDAGNYVGAVGGLENAIEVLQMMAAGKLEGRAVLYPHIGRTDLKLVDGWSGEEEKKFLEDRLI